MFYFFLLTVSDIAVLAGGAAALDITWRVAVNSLDFVAGGDALLLMQVAMLML